MGYGRSIQSSMSVRHVGGSIFCFSGDEPLPGSPGSMSSRFDGWRLAEDVGGFVDAAAPFG
jgi:hypothetical protein